MNNKNVDGVDILCFKNYPKTSRVKAVFLDLEWVERCYDSVLSHDAHRVHSPFVALTLKEKLIDLNSLLKVSELLFIYQTGQKGAKRPLKKG